MAGSSSDHSRPASFQIVDDLTAGRGLVTCEMVPALVATDGGHRHGTTELADYRY